MEPKRKKRKRIKLYDFRFKLHRPYYNPYFGSMKAESYDSARSKLTETFPKYTILKLQQWDDKKRIKKKS